MQNLAAHELGRDGVMLPRDDACPADITWAKVSVKDRVCLLLAANLRAGIHQHGADDTRARDATNKLQNAQLIHGAALQSMRKFAKTMVLSCDEN